MSVRNLAGLGIACVVIGGPLLLVGLPEGALGGVGHVGGWILWAGLVLVLASLLQLGRIEHRMLRVQGERLSRLQAGLDAITDTGDGALPARLAGVEQTLIDQRRELLHALDVRTLGLHEVVRELAGAPSPADRDPQ